MNVIFLALILFFVATEHYYVGWVRKLVGGLILLLSIYIWNMSW